MGKTRVLFSFLAVICSFSWGAIKHRFLLVDEARHTLVYTDENDSTRNWSAQTVAWGIDMQLVGNHRVLVGRVDGFDEYDINTHAKVRSQSPAGVSNVNSCRRLPDGSTLMLSQGMIWKVDSTGKVLRSIVISGMGMTRYFRISSRGTFLFGSDLELMETDTDGNVLKRMPVPGATPCIFQALRMRDGTVYASGAYGCSIAKTDSAGTLLKQFGGLPGPAGYGYHDFTGFQILENGHIVVANWMGHDYSSGDNGVGIMEFDTTGTLVWSWADHARASSPTQVLVIDDINTALLNDDRTGFLAPVDTLSTVVTRPHAVPVQRAGQNSIGISMLSGRVLFENLTPRPWERMRIIGVDGKICADLQAGDRKTVVWDCRNKTGRQAATGLYIALFFHEDGSFINRSFVVVR